MSDVRCQKYVIPAKAGISISTSKNEDKEIPVCAGMTKYSIIFLCVFCFMYSFSTYAAEPRAPWAVYYSDALPYEAFEAYDLLVLDSDHHPPLSPLTQQGKLLLGYISLGEAEQERHYFEHVKAEGILLQENTYWKGSYFVDVRDPRWTKRILEDLIPAILHKGFDGIFLDTLDNPAELERQDPKKYKGMTKAAERLVHAIRRHYPTIPIMMNRGYEILPKVARHITMVMAESLYTDYNFEKKTYDYAPEEFYTQQRDMLKEMQDLYPELQIYALDYWNPEDTETIKKIYATQRKNGFAPYVATIELNKLVPEPE